MSSSRKPPSKISLPEVRDGQGDVTLGPHRKYVVVFLPGNPCVVEFYSTFLSMLYDQLSFNTGIRKGMHSIQVLGLSLPGFECDDYGSLVRIQSSPPFGIDSQIRFIEETLKEISQVDCRIILVGHSLGAYLMMEIIRRNREALRFGTRGDIHTHIVGGISLLSPITQLAQSEGGQNFGWLLIMPGFVMLVTLFTKVITLIFPFSLLQHLIKLASGYPDDAVTTTCHFIRSKWGVRQSLHLMREEMTRMGDDAWDDEVWGTASPSHLPHPRAPLYFLFGENDKWISSDERDRLIRTRGRRKNSKVGTKDTDLAEGWKPLMVIDKTGITHDFSIRHSRVVANLASEWVRDIIYRDL